MITRRTFALMATASALVLPLAQPGYAQNSIAPSTEASHESLAASATIAGGSVALFAAGGDFVVASVTPLVDASKIVLRSVANGVEVSVRFTGETLTVASLATGETISVIAEATGYSLIHAGRIMAFIPNQAGRALIYEAHSTQI